MCADYGATHMKLSLLGTVALAVAGTLAACSSSTSDTADAAGSVRHRSDITPVTRVEDAIPGVFIPAFPDCRVPLAGKICTNVSIAGATEEGKSFASYASCEIVRTQRPYYPSKPTTPLTAADDPRLKDAAYMAEVEWSRAQVAASGCVCCHDAQLAPRGASRWDIRAPGIWLDSVSNEGLALFAGLADSSVLGAYPAAENHGFDRTAVGLPSVDPARMKKLVVGELTRRGVTEEQARTVKPFGGPIYDASVRAPGRCGAGEGVDPTDSVMWKGGPARYVYVLEAGSKNPGVPPNLDRPAGTVWRLDVLASGSAVDSGLTYGTTPDGSFQDTPAEGLAPKLVKGRTYALVALRDVGLPTTSCTFVYGEPLATEDPPAPRAPATAAFGKACADSKECSAEASYCALMPGGTSGYCTTTGCKEDASVCPEGWSCFDVSMFQPGAPSICTKP
jgi:hypothetical protein